MLCGLAAVFQTGCSKYFHQPLTDHTARIGEETEVTRQLRALPDPKDPLYAAVYKFRDQTGQYRPQEVGSGFSTVVTQGATNILIKALEESKWLVPIERENVGNLLNERKIIRSGRVQYEGVQGPAVPPLIYANLILEGGIVSYDANIVTGGAGARYFGAGGQARYRQDRVTVYLRAVATNNGQILKTVYTSKTILSQALDGGIFRFVSFSRLLEAETGYTYNEPSDLAVKEAIEKAVYSLIVEGLKGNFWDVTEGQEAAKQRVISEYDSEVVAMRETNIFGRKVFNKPVGTALRLGVNVNSYQGDFPNSEITFGFGGSLQHYFSSGLGFEIGGGISRFSTESFYQEDITFAEANIIWRVLPFDRFSPVAYGGGGVLFDQDGRSDTDQSRNYFKFQVGGGFEYYFSPAWSIDLLFDYNYLLDDEIDRVVSGQYNDLYFRGQLGIKYFLGANENKSKN